MPAEEETGLDLALKRAGSLVARARTFTVALADYGIDLPDPTPAETDQAQLRAIAGLYLVAELDQAGVIEAAEALAGLGSARAANLDFGAAAADVAAFWRGRHDRLAPMERAALFAGLFGQGEAVAPAGTPVNAHFFDAMVETTEALYKLDELEIHGDGGRIAAQARVRRGARALVEGLRASASGLTVFIAEDCLATLRAALDLFRHPAMLALFGARDSWAAVAGARRLTRLPARPAALHARRGRAGMTVLAWAAEAAPHLGDTGRALIGLDNPVIAAAIEWLETSLAIADAAEPPPRPPPPSTGSPWAGLGR